MPTNEQEILRAARNLARLGTQRRKLKRQLKQVEKDLRLERRHMKALVSLHATDPDVIPSRLFGSGVGVSRGRRPVATVADLPAPAVSTDTAAFVDGLDPDEKGGQS